MPEGSPALNLEVQSLLKPDEGAHRGLTYRRLIRRLHEATRSARTTVVFANTRAFTEKVTHDLRGVGRADCCGADRGFGAGACWVVLTGP